MVNHSLLLTQAVVAGDSSRISSRPLVCDEAHNLEDAATSVLKYEVSEATLRRLLRAVHDRPRRAGLLAAARKAGFAATDEALKAAAAAVGEADTHVDNLSSASAPSWRLHTVASREERARYGATVELRPSVLRGPGGPALQESAMALLETLGRLRPALKNCQALRRACAAGEELDGRPGRTACPLARLRLLRGGEDIPVVLDLYGSDSYVRVIGIEAEGTGVPRGRSRACRST